jgi:hypothetical protein
MKGIQTFTLEAHFTTCSFRNQSSRKTTPLFDSLGINQQATKQEPLLLNFSMYRAENLKRNYGGDCFFMAFLPRKVPLNT